MVELYHAGRSTTELSQDFGPHAQSIRNWVAWAKREGDESEQSDGQKLTAWEREELNRLRRENRQLRLEREILSKATAWFAREANRIPPQDSDS
jgi:transposase